MALSLEGCPLSRAEYDALVQRGALEDARVELLHGLIVTMSPHGKPHGYGITALTALLVPAVGARGKVRVQLSLAVSASSEPEPDVAVVPPGDYLDEHPTTAWLVIEVASSSLARDREKAALYAAAGVEEYWIVNLVEQVFEVHALPGPEGYARMSRHGRGESLRVPVLPDVEVRVEDVLPPMR
jgi:Uma2 family endonuclease